MSSAKSVRFAGGVKNNKRSRRKISVVGGSLDNTDETDDPNDGNPDDVRNKRLRVETVDDGTAKREDDDDGDGDANHETGDASGILSEKELLQAKRKRSLQRDLEFQKGGTHIDYTTSLAAEEGDAKVEPFHMRAEEEDGTGYFDGETYVFRSQNNIDEEPDAWLDDLQEKQGSHVRVDAASGQKSSLTDDGDSGQSDEEEGLGSDKLDRDALYRKVVQLIEGKESVSQALRRYGQQCQKTSHRGKHKAKRGTTSVAEQPPDEAQQRQAKKNLNDLTSAANALLLHGEVDIYQTSRTVLLSKLSTNNVEVSTAKTHHLPDKMTKEAPAEWEYLGNQDDQVHGPYTTTQMIDWTQAGYFVGAQKVKIRTIRSEQVSTHGDDLMADLMDDEDDDSSPSETQVKGDWVWSTDVHFRSYIVDS